MNWLDITILIVAGIGLIKGLYDGMIRQIVALVALVVGVYLYSAAGAWLSGYLTALNWFPPAAVSIISSFIGFVIVVAIVLLAGKIVNSLINATPLSFLNHLGGGLLGLILTIVFISLIFNIIEMFDTQSVILSQTAKVESKFYFQIKNFIPTIFPGNLFPVK